MYISLVFFRRTDLPLTARPLLPLSSLCDTNLQSERSKLLSPAHYFGVFAFIRFAMINYRSGLFAGGLLRPLRWRRSRLGDRRNGSSFEKKPKTQKEAPSSATAAKIIRNEKDLKWTEREEAPKWMRRMTPPRGGTAPPNKKEMALIGVVIAAGFYSWVIDPPKRQKAAGDHAQTAEGRISRGENGDLE